MNYSVFPCSLQHPEVAMDFTNAQFGVLVFQRSSSVNEWLIWFKYHLLWEYLRDIWQCWNNHLLFGGVCFSWDEMCVRGCGYLDKTGNSSYDELDGWMSVGGVDQRRVVLLTCSPAGNKEEQGLRSAGLSVQILFELCLDIVMTYSGLLSNSWGSNPECPRCQS